MAIEPTPPPVSSLQTTIVTAFLALGDPNSIIFAENLVLQQSELRMVLWLKDPMVVYTDGWSLNFVTETRKAAGLEAQTTVVNITLKDLPLYSKYTLFHDVISRDKRSRHEEEDVEDSILSNSKPYFLANASVSYLFAVGWV